MHNINKNGRKTQPCKTKINKPTKTTAPPHTNKNKTKQNKTNKTKNDL